MEIFWFQEAIADLTIIRDYISKGNPLIAKQIILKITNYSTTLSHSPGIGRPGRVRSIREFILAEIPYIIVYRSKDSKVEILRILHQSRIWPKRF